MNSTRQPPAPDELLDERELWDVCDHCEDGRVDPDDDVCEDCCVSRDGELFFESGENYWGEPIGPRQDPNHPTYDNSGREIMYGGYEYAYPPEMTHRNGEGLNLFDEPAVAD